MRNPARLLYALMPRSPVMSDRIFWLLTAAAVILAHLPTLDAAFVKDDWALILSASPSPSRALTHSWPGGFFRPSAEVFLALQRTLFATNALPYHVVSLLVHALSAAVAYRIFSHLSNSDQISRNATALFLLHPLQTESVSWVSGQMSLFSGLCALLTIYLTLYKRPIASAALLVVAIVGMGFYENYFAAIVLVLFLCFALPDVRTSITRWKAIALILGLPLLSAGYAYWRLVELDLRGGNYVLYTAPTAMLTNAVYYAYLLLGGSAIGGRIAHYAPTLALEWPYTAYLVPPLLIATAAVLSAALAIRPHALCTWPTLRRPLIGLAALFISLLPALVLSERPRRLSYLAIVIFAFILSLAIDHLRTHSTRLGRAALLSIACLSAITLYARNADWRTAGQIERAIPPLIAAYPQCKSAVFDAPNLLGDALFFNAISMSIWLNQLGQEVAVYDRQSLQQDYLPIPTCHFVYRSGTFFHAPQLLPPRFIRGQNWIPH